MKSVLIGAGDIGIGYDFDSPRYLTHLGLLLNISEDITVYDPDIKRLDKILNHYPFVQTTDTFNYDEVANFEVVCIASPTINHAEALINCLNKNVPVVIVEKPLSYSLIELNELLFAYSKSKSFVLVNYIRRFQPSIVKLKCFLNSNNFKPLAIVGTYYKGLIHTGSHILDLIEFLLDESISWEKCVVLSKSYDYFKTDPTTSFFLGKYNCSISMTGVSSIKYPVLNLNILFDEFTVVFKNNISELYFDLHNDSITDKTFSTSGVHEGRFLSEYMKPLGPIIQNVLNGKKEESNFEPAVQLNKNLIKLNNGKFSN
jgi:predicted dehydrogenase